MCKCIFAASLCIFLGGGLAVAQHASPATAVTRSFEDPSLEWGPCPAFLPEGCAIAVLHGDPAQPNPDIFFKVPGKSLISRHWHTSPERMVLVAGELHVTYDGHDTAVLKPGMYAYGPAKLPHQAACVSATPCVLAIAFESPVDAFPIAAAEGYPGYFMNSLALLLSGPEWGFRDVSVSPYRRRAGCGVVRAQ